MAEERKHVLTRVKAGDYLLPSNDGKTIWRIARYSDGPSFGLEGWVRDREVWGLWRWTGDSLTALAAAADVGDWSAWDFWEGLLETRQKAIQAALASLDDPKKAGVRTAADVAEVRPIDPAEAVGEQRPASNLAHRFKESDQWPS